MSTVRERLAAAISGRAGLPVSGASWLFEFLRSELAPYPGRASAVARMVLAATCTMLVINTFHLPGGALGGYYALAFSRESLRNTIQNTWLTIAFFCLGTVYSLIGVAMFVSEPLTHFLWVIGSLYLIFFIMGTARNYNLAAGFSFMIATAIPIWDGTAGIDAKVALTLYTLLAIVVAALCTLFVELLYRSFSPRDPMMTGIADRFHVSATMLRAAAQGAKPAKADKSRLLQYAMIGPSFLRQQLLRAGISTEVRSHASAAIAVAGRLVELCAISVSDIETHTPLPREQVRLRQVADAMTRYADVIRNMRDPDRIGTSHIPIWKAPDDISYSLPLLPEIERGVALMGEILTTFGTGEQPKAPRTGAEKAREQTRLLAELFGARPSMAFVPDAFTNRAHLVFALRGSLAASFCYIFYNAIDWPGINTSVATCIITALSTIGSSRQKQALRISGAVAGGFLLALPAQVFLLPYMDSISSFTLFFMAGSAVAAWFATASARLSYFGLQIALAFYLVNLQEPFRQISLAIARDRVVGMLVGLLAMWLVFDRIAAPLASVRMNAELRSILNLLGDLACSATEGSEEAHQRLRQTINEAFSQMNAQADAMQFEFGARRAGQLRQRERMQAMQPAMRSIFLLEATVLRSNDLAATNTVPRDAALGIFLRKYRDALRAIAALPEGGSARAAVEEAGEALARLREEAGEARLPSHGNLPALYTGMFTSLRNLERAAVSPAAEAPVYLRAIKPV